MKLRFLYLSVILFVISSCGGGGEDEAPNPCASTISVSVSSKQDASAGQSDGRATILASGGNGGFSYKLNSGSFQSANVFNGLATGNYTVTVKDSEGCTSTVQFVIAESGGGNQTVPSFASDVFPIFQTRCATSGCHVSGGSAPFVINGYDDIKSRDARVKARVAARTMPSAGSPSLTDAQINTIVAWVDGGSPNN